jgi:hypothetical protein
MQTASHSGKLARGSRRVWAHLGHSHMTLLALFAYTSRPAHASRRIVFSYRNIFSIAVIGKKRRFGLLGNEMKP